MHPDGCLCNSFSAETNLCLDSVQGFRIEKGSIWSRKDLSRTCAKFAFQIESDYSPFLSLLRAITDSGETIYDIMIHQYHLSTALHHPTVIPSARTVGLAFLTDEIQPKNTKREQDFPFKCNCDWKSIQFINTKDKPQGAKTNLFFSTIFETLVASLHVRGFLALHVLLLPIVPVRRPLVRPL